MKYYVTGDIHGNFDILFNYAIERFSDCKIFVAGDCGFGFDKLNYYKELFKKYNDKLNSKNIIIFYIRGNHDNPKYFENTNLDTSNIKLLQDYSIIDDKILIIGGATSYDKAYRHKNFSWWVGERVKQINIENIDKNDIKIIISHEAPLEVNVKTKESNIFVSNRTLKSIKEDREYLSSVSKYINPKYWFFGHYHERHIEKIENTIFQCCEMYSYTHIGIYEMIL